MNTSPSLGRHIIVEYYDCNPQLLSDVTFIETAMVDAAKTAGATVINSTFHHFSPFGVSGVVVIQESHLAIHSWPEYGYASVDIFTCGGSVDPWVSYEYLKEKLEAKHGSAIEALRGQISVVSKGRTLPEPEYTDYPEQEPVTPKYNRNIWLTDKDENIALSLRHTGEVFYKKQSPFQRVEVLNSYAYGKFLAIDSMVMCTERDEHAYHEMIVHVPMLTQTNIKKALIIGGGDGGTVKELVRHHGITEIVMVEIDEAVIEASKLHLPSISKELDNAKVQVIVGDGIDFVAKALDNTYDLIIIDSSDPVGPAEGLFSVDFFANCHRILTENGVMVGQSESPRFHSDAFVQLFDVYKEVFGAEKVWCYLSFISTYPTGMWSFCYCSKGTADPLKDFNKELSAAFTKENNLKYYNENIATAAFALPGFVVDLLEHKTEEVEA